MRSFCLTLCALILGLTAAAKLYALLHGTRILNVQHGQLHVTFHTVILLALLLELGVFMLWLRCGARAFLLACGGLGAGFLFYHATMHGLGYHSPCGCLGGILDASRAYGEFENRFAWLLALALFVAGFVGARPRKLCPHESPDCTRNGGGPPDGRR